MRVVIASLLIICVGLLACQAQSQSFNSTTDKPVGWVKGNYWMLAMQDCKMGHGMTLHGLWPQWDTDCTREQFNPTYIASIRDDLEQYWPTCQGKNTNNKFWSHEWSKHGTCSGMNQLEYFGTALKLRDLHAADKACQHVAHGQECRVCVDLDFNVMPDCGSNTNSTNTHKNN